VKSEVNCKILNKNKTNLKLQQVVILLVIKKNHYNLNLNLMDYRRKWKIGLIKTSWINFSLSVTPAGQSNKILILVSTKTMHMLSIKKVNLNHQEIQASINAKKYLEKIKI